MKRLLSGLVLSVFATAASAEWVLVGANDRMNVYADPATKSRAGNIVRMWALTDREKPNVIGGKAYHSARFYYQYECIEKTSQQLQASAFAGKMLTGEVVFVDNDPGNKSFIAPGTIDDAKLNYACE